MRRKIITLILIIGLWQGFALSIDKAKPCLYHL